jgi:hypothetical protein
LLRASADKGPTEGNHRLTALTGSLLAPLLALVFVTGLLMDALWHIHYVVGFVLIPVVALKLASTGYRAMRYYIHNPIYREAGPPELLPRLTAPILVLSVVTALATGVALYFERSRSGILSTLHTDSAVICAVLVGLHLLTYALDALGTAARELNARLSRLGSIRVAAVIASLALGIVLAIVTYSYGVWPARHQGQREGFRFSPSPTATHMNRFAETATQQ